MNIRGIRATLIHPIIIKVKLFNIFSYRDYLAEHTYHRGIQLVAEVYMPSSNDPLRPLYQEMDMGHYLKNLFNYDLYKNYNKQTMPYLLCLSIII